jgi:two-component system NtrC family sensor kinase
MKKWVERGIDKENRRDEMYETLDLIASESRRCGDLVKNLLSFSRTSPMNLEKVNLNQIIDRCVRLVHPRTEMQNIQVQLAVDDYLPTVFCDGAQIEQVLLALIMNAIDAMPHGGNLWLGNRVHDEEHIELEVRDDGIGIPQDLVPRLFEPFTTTKEVGKGVGLGLAISRNIVDRHSGRIEVESEPGRGTRFRIILPLDSRVAEEATRELAAKA